MRKEQNIKNMATTDAERRFPSKENVISILNLLNIFRLSQNPRTFQAITIFQ